MFVINKLRRSPRQEKGNRHEDARQSPNAELPIVAMVDVFVFIQGGHERSRFNLSRPQEFLRSAARRVGDRSIWSVQKTEQSPPSSVTGKNTPPRSDVEKMQALAARRFELSRTHACDICGVVRS